MGSILSRLLGRNPTSDWPDAAGGAPSFDPERGTLGGLRFGDPFEKLRVLGRPDDFDGDPKGTCNLHYDAAGYTAECERGVFVGVAFYFVARPDRKKRVPASASVGGMRLTSTTKPDDVRAWFGDPSATDACEDYIELDYERGKTFMLFDFDPGTGLEYFNAFLDDA